ncbi:Mitogen-activated protein kinase 19-like protein [Drosera capensis]
MQQDQRKKGHKETEFFTDYGGANRYKILEVIGKGSYGVVCAAIDTHTGEKVAIKKINNIFEHVSDAIRILREIKLLRLLRHPDIVEIKGIMLPPSSREFRDIYVVFELMESDLHQVIKANDDLVPEHLQFFLYQMLRALKYMHTGLKSINSFLEPILISNFFDAANVYHRDLKPKNILANANCKLKICDFGLARVAFNDTPATTLWTDYVATRWYRAPELCGSFFSKYTPAIDIWSIGCIFAEVLMGKPLFPGKSVSHQLDLITDLLGTPSPDTILGVRNDKARKYLMSMRKKRPVSFSEKFSTADPLALNLLQRMLAFDPKDRPTAEQVCILPLFHKTTRCIDYPYFKGLAKVEREPACQPISKVEFQFDSIKVAKEEIRELIFQEILEYHPKLRQDYINGTDRTSFIYPSALDQFKKQFVHLEENCGRSGPVIPLQRKHVSLPRSTVHTSMVPPQQQAVLASYADQQNKADSRVGNGTGSSSSSLKQPSGIPSGEPGTVGPGLSDAGRNIKGSYDPRVVTRAPVLPPHGISPHYFFRTSTPNQLRFGTEPNQAILLAKDQLPRQHDSTNKPHADISIDINTNSYIPQSLTKEEQYNGLVALDAKLLQAQSKFGPAGAMAAHRNAGTVQYGMS